MISVSHLSSMVLAKAQLSQHRNGCSVTSLECDSGNTFSCPSIEMVAVSHVSRVIAAIHSVVPVLELLWCHISGMWYKQHTQLSQYWGCCGVTSLEWDSGKTLNSPSIGIVTSFESDSGNMLSWPSTGIVAMPHLSNMKWATRSVVPVLGLLRCHISSVILAPCLVVPVLGLLRLHAQWSQNWNDYGVTSP